MSVPLSTHDSSNIHYTYQPEIIIVMENDVGDQTCNISVENYYVLHYFK